MAEAWTEPHQHHKHSGFDLAYISEQLEASLCGNNDIDLGFYLQGYRELCKFCELMGTLWGFVGSEINKHVRDLNELRAHDNEGGYSTLRRMVKHEMANNTQAGCKAMLLLHRGLDFIRVFLRKMSEMGPEERMSAMGQEVYSQTLGKFHNAFIKKAANLAMYILPTRDNLILRICNGVEKDRDRILFEVLPKMLNISNEVYRRTQSCFESNNLLDIV